MKNALMCFAFAVIAKFSFGDTITNTVVIVSNYYNNVYHESVVTQKVKNTHVEYYFTNNVYTVSNTTLVVSQTNLNVNVINTNFGPWLAKCEAAVVGASNALSSATYAASASAASASAAGSSASAASSYASRAASSAASARAAASDGISRINQRIQWFDDHSGETITVVTTNLTIYNPSYVIDKGNYCIDLNTMSISVRGGKSIKLRIYANWSSFGYPTYDDVLFRNVDNDVGSFSFHYGDPTLDISMNKSVVHLFIDDIYWSTDGNWYADVHWYHNNMSDVYGKARYSGAGDAFPPNKYNSSEIVEGQITLRKISQETSSSTYNSYLGNNLYLWRSQNDTSTSDFSQVINFITDDDLRRATNSIVTEISQRIADIENRMSNIASP